MANDNIFQQYLKPPKSVMEYTADLDEADTRKQALQSNALTLAAGQQKQADSARDREAENVLSRLYASGQNTDQIAVGLAQAGYGKHALAFTKQQQDLAKDKALTEQSLATTGKTTQETGDLAYKQREEKRQKAISDIAAFTDPQQALASLALHEQAGDIAPEQAALVRQTIPQNPADFPKWQVGMLQRIMTADKAAGQIAPDANAVLQAKTTTATNAATVAASRYSTDSAARTAGARLNFDKEKEAGTEDSALGPMATRMIAQQYLAGDNTALGNIGRGTQGAKNLTIVRNEVARQANAAGMNGADIAAKMAEFGGMKAGQRTLGTRTANIEVAAAEAAELAPLALAASLKVPRSGALPFGKLQVMFDANTNDPDIREFAMANTALVNAYGQVMSRGGAATVSDKTHAAELLSTAFDQPSYARAVAQLQREIQAAQRAPGKVRTEMSAATSGRPGGHAAPAAATPGAKPSLSDIFN